MMFINKHKQELVNFKKRLTKFTIFLAPDDLIIYLDKLFKSDPMYKSFLKIHKATGLSSSSEYILKESLTIFTKDLLKDKKVIFIPKEEWSKPVKLYIGRNRNEDVLNFLYQYYIEPTLLNAIRLATSHNLVKKSKSYIRSVINSNIIKNTELINKKINSLPLLPSLKSTIFNVLKHNVINNTIKDFEGDILKKFKMGEKNIKYNYNDEIDLIKHSHILMDSYLKKLSLYKDSCYAMSRDQFSSLLYDISNKKGLVNHEKARFLSSQYASEYDASHLQSLLNLTIIKVTNAMEYYIYNKIGLDAPSYCPTVGDDVNFETISFITGYFIMTFKFTVLKDYSKLNASIRILGKSLVSTDAQSEEDSMEHYAFSQVSIDTNLISQEESNYRSTIKKVFNNLRTFDKKLNQYFSNVVYKSSNIPIQKKSMMAYTFFWMIHPELCGGKYIEVKKYKLKNVDVNLHEFYDEIIENEIGTPYIFNKNIDVLKEYLLKNFKEEFESIVEYINMKNQRYGETIAPKKTSESENINCAVNQLFESKVQKNGSVHYILTYQLAKIKPNNSIEVIKSVSSKIKDNLISFEEAKQLLKEKMQVKYKKLELEKDTIIKSAYKNLYK